MPIARPGKAGAYPKPNFDSQRYSSGNYGLNSLHSEPLEGPPTLFSVKNSEEVVFKTNVNRFQLAVALNALLNFFNAFGRADDSKVGADFVDLYFADVLFHGVLLVAGLLRNYRNLIQGTARIKNYNAYAGNVWKVLQIKYLQALPGGGMFPPQSPGPPQRHTEPRDNPVRAGHPRPVRNAGRHRQAASRLG
jgi:hypothetical protein